MKKFVAIILGIGFLHRLVLLGTRQLWVDELMQARVIRFGSPAEILTRLRDGMDLASPLDFFVQKGVTVLLGDSAWALRLHAVIFGTLSIWIFYRVARFLFADRVARYATVLFAFYPLAYHYSQEARPYALLMFLTLLSYDLLLRQLYGKDRRPQGWILIAAVLALLLYTSFLGALIVCSQLVCLVVSVMLRLPSEAAPGEGEAGQGSAGQVSLGWSAVAFYGLATLAAFALFYPWLRFVWARPLLAPAAEILDPKLILRLIKELGDNSYPAALLLLLGLATGIRALLRHGRRKSLLWLLTWFLVPIPVLLLVEVWAGYFFAIRHILHATPPLLLIAGYGLSYVGERLTILPHLPYQLSSPAIAYAGILILMSAYIGQSHAVNEPADWRGTADYLSKTLRAGDAVSAPGVYPLLEYYFPELEPFLIDDLDPGRGSLARARIQRRIVVCYDKMWPDACGGFRIPALKDAAWGKVQFKAFMVFVRTQ
jgi:mannosyltransferase